MPLYIRTPLIRCLAAVAGVAMALAAPAPSALAKWPTDQGPRPAPTPYHLTSAVTNPDPVARARDHAHIAMPDTGGGTWGSFTP